MTTSTRRTHITLDHDRSPFILERRRNLFPSDDDADSELGHISPLYSDLSSDNENEGSHILQPKGHNFVQNNCCGTPTSSIAPSEKMSPLLLSPYTNNTFNIKDTPKKLSPSQALKTPHDTSSKSNSILKKEQKTLLEESKNSKRKCSPRSSPEQCKYLKSDPKVSKVRTALFPEYSLDMSLSTKSFYSKNPESIVDKSLKEKNYKLIKLSTAKHSRRNNRKFGQINNGVRHKIKKPKTKKISRKVTEKAFKNLSKMDDALTEYIQDLAELKKSGDSNNKLIKLSESQSKINTCETKNDLKEVKDTQKEIFSEEDKENTPHDDNTLKLENKQDKIQYDSFAFQDDDVDSTTNIENILSVLKDSPEQDGSTSQLSAVSPNRIVLEAHTSILASENSIQLHYNSVANMILSPISQMCDVTSGLALDSPKKARNLNSVLNSLPTHSNSFSDVGSESSATMAQQEGKLFPIFYGECNSSRGQKRERTETKRNLKRFKAISSDQMLLDAGQKRFGYTHCNECDIVYHMGDPGDEIAHMNYHNSNHILRFAGWKNERVVADFQQMGRIILVLCTDSRIWLKKVKDLMEVIKRDLGCYEIDYNVSNSQVYLYIKNRTIAGCAVAAVPQEPGHKMLSTLNNVTMCSEETYPIKCGISHIWVSINHRKQGIATALLNSVKRNFIYGRILNDEDIALTSPTEDGCAFAAKYFKTPNFLIYYV
ncbi:N-acetyltransferase ESCO2 [Sitophilus oryzae]|uniref:N-acetyltransferase ESCO2 n=1 Tax=Sitophilus oryzae TaxID=7048 RepID=A0A6J2Y4L2_SITOR|nr:N-acetyltransferase ESCO2 [Sitophilus oryzae]XP_030758612.1 N-acetyltransferase ESCO2 [Sitophilus oryzae]